MSTVGIHRWSGQPASQWADHLFKLPDTWAPAGASPIGTVGDLLTLGRTHLAGGVPPVGLGWLPMPFGRTTVLSHPGASPGGAALLALGPDAVSFLPVCRAWLWPG